MKKFKHITICFCIFFCIHINIYAQDKALDSLKLLLGNTTHDSTRCRILSILSLYAPDGEWEKYNDELKTVSLARIKVLQPNNPEFKLINQYYAIYLTNLGVILQEQGNVSAALNNHLEALKINEAVAYKKGIGTSLNNIGSLYLEKGDMQNALDYYHKAIKIQEEVGDKRGMTYILNNIGLIYSNKGNIQKALSYYEKCLKIGEEIKDKDGVALTLNNIAVIYQHHGETLKALSHYQKSLKIRQEIGNKNGEAQSLNNIGFLYHNFGDPTITSSQAESKKEGIIKALFHYEKALKKYEESANKSGIAICLNNIGGIYRVSGDPAITNSKEESMKAGRDKALQIFNKSYKIYEEVGDKKGLATSLLNIGSAYLEMAMEQKPGGGNKKYYKPAQDNLLKSMSLCKELGFPDKIKNTAFRLNLLYKNLALESKSKTEKNKYFKLAFENYELHIQMRDSVNNVSNRKAIIKSQLKYEYEKQAAADSVAHAKESEIKNVLLQKQKAEISAKKNQQYALFGGLGLVIIFAIFMYKRFIITKKQKIIIEQQKEIVEQQKYLVEEKQKEILDSIHYAKKIQTALIPSEKQFEKNLERLRKN